MKKFGKDPEIGNGDVVILLDRVTLHHYSSARRAIGQSFRIQMVSRGKGDHRPRPIKHKKHLLLLVKSDDVGKNIVPIDPFADDEVSSLMNKPKVEMQAKFYEGGLDQFAGFKQVRKQLHTFKDPDDMLIGNDLDNPMSAMNLRYPGEGRTVKEVLVTEPKPIEKQKEKTSKEAKEPPPKMAPALPPVTTSRGRVSKQTDFFGI